ncbi:carbamoyltransferase HypF [bacterium]|nr:carbamoyltransferase HypF [bacterium]
MLDPVTKRKRLNISGIVQGVGFRPFIYKMANKYHLTGFVLNNPQGVIIEIEGKESQLMEFIEKLRHKAPPLSRIEGMTISDIPLLGESQFDIKPSTGLSEKFVLISPDVATCHDCLQELFNPRDRRFHYPFINCTNCGPRFTIIEDIPYDRPLTTMKDFELCEDCESEYRDPRDRRFHAQPNACPKCGPKVSLGEVKKGKWIPFQTDKPIEEAVRLINRGYILAIKGLGGYHLACNAKNAETVDRLRKMKDRGNKPFALMATDINAVKNICEVKPTEEQLMLSQQRPIVLLKKRSGEEHLLAPSIAPCQNYLGVMLPYTPLHHLLLALSNQVLVMTSGNLRNEPICFTEKDAFKKLEGVADYFLIHNREIHMRCDDSVTRVFQNQEMPLRRSRGYVPEPVTLPFTTEKHILACGAELKNSFALGRDNYAFISHYIGDLENLETLQAFEKGIQHFEHLFSINPEIIAYDLHPEYLPTKYAQKQYSDEKYHLVGVQHHEAHIASAMVDCKLDQPVIGVAFDGLGYGRDGNLWGGEFFLGDYSGFQRMAHLTYVPMPGGTVAIKEPWRMTISYLTYLGGTNNLEFMIKLTDAINPEQIKLINSMIINKLNSPLTSSVGRLFDAVSALLGVCTQVTYEGQAAIELEAIAGDIPKSPYNFGIEFDQVYIINPLKIFEEIIAELQLGIPRRAIAAKFHVTVAQIILQTCLKIRDDTGINSVVLSGGVFQNTLLLQIAKEKLSQNRFKVYIPSRTPVNDGCISLGQIALAGFLYKE